MHRLFFVGLVSMIACGDDTSASGPAAPGDFGGACLAGATCRDGLSCSSGGFCEGGAGSAGAAAAGDGDGDGEGGGYVAVSPDGCPPRAPCGDGVVEPTQGEVCDPGNGATGVAMNLADQSCSSLGMSGDGLRCNCRCQFDLDGCATASENGMGMGSGF